MAIFAMPSLGADMEVATLVEWLVAPGDTVTRGDIVAVVETQKGAIEIECFDEGKVQELKAAIGEELPVGAPLAVILAPGESVRPAAIQPEPSPQQEPSPQPEAAPATPAESKTTAQPIARPIGAVPASPAARVRALELGIDLGCLEGSFPGGGIVLADVEAHLAAGSAATPPAPASPLQEMRKAIAAAMTRSKQTIPHFYLSETIDVQPATDWLARFNEGRPPAERVLLGALFVRATVGAAARIPVMNGHFVEGVFHPSAKINPGVAVALRGGGLVAPAILDAEAMTVEETMTQMRSLVSRARSGRLRNSEMTEGTLTISSLGETGAEAMTGVIFPPQVALVGLGAPHLRPWVVDGQIVPRSLVTLTISADHRASDGRQVAKFITEFESLIASPEAL